MTTVTADTSTRAAPVADSARLPDWRSLFHDQYDPALALKFTAVQKPSDIGVPQALRLKLALLARLDGRQERVYAAHLRRSIFTENPVREGIVTNCLMYEADRLTELRNTRGNNFRDQISKALLEAGDLNPIENPERRRRESPLLRRTVPAIVRARIGAFSLGEIESWLMDGREPGVRNYFYRGLLQLAHDRRSLESEAAQRILSGAPDALFRPLQRENSRERLLALRLINPEVLNGAVSAVRPSETPVLTSDIVEIRRGLTSKSSRGISDWLDKVPALQALVGS